MIWITDAGSSGAFGIVCACVGMAAASFFIYALHDWAEALAARAMGDKTVGLSFSYVGQMRSGFNIMSTVMLLLFGIGWKTHIKSDETRRARSIGTSLCGPLACFALGIIVFIILQAASRLYAEHSILILETVIYLLKGAFRACIMISVFSLFPLKPFDGGYILRALCPGRLQTLMDSSEKISLAAAIFVTALVSALGLSGGINLNI